MTLTKLNTMTKALEAEPGRTGHSLSPSAGQCRRITSKSIPELQNEVTDGYYYALT